MQVLISRWDFPSTDDSARSFQLRLDPASRLVWETDDISLRRPVELPATVPGLYDGEFHHIGATWSPSTINLYVDGLLVATTASQGGELNGATTTPFRLGRKSGIGDPFRFTGVLDEPAVIRRPLTATEMASLVGAGPKGLCTFAKTKGVVGPTLQIPGDAGGVDPVVTPDGRYLLFRTRSTNIVSVVNDAASQVPGVDFDLFDSSRDDLMLPRHEGNPGHQRRHARVGFGRLVRTHHRRAPAHRPARSRLPTLQRCCTCTRDSASRRSESGERQSSTSDRHFSPWDFWWGRSWPTSSRHTLLIRPRPAVGGVSRRIEHVRRRCSASRPAPSDAASTSCKRPDRTAPISGR